MNQSKNENPIIHQSRYGLSRTDTGITERFQQRTFRTLDKGTLAIDMFHRLATAEKMGEGEGAKPPKVRRSRSDVG